MLTGICFACLLCSAFASSVCAQDDAFEDNDSMWDAATIQSGVHDGMKLYDEDWFRINLQEGDYLAIAAEGTSVNLYGPRGDFRDWCDNPFARRVSEPGDWIIRVYSSAGDYSGQDYSLNVFINPQIGSGATYKIYGGQFPLGADQWLDPVSNGYDYIGSASDSASFDAAGYNWLEIVVEPGNVLCFDAAYVRPLRGFDFMGLSSNVFRPENSPHHILDERLTIIGMDYTGNFTGGHLALGPSGTQETLEIQLPSDNRLWYFGIERTRTSDKVSGTVTYGLSATVEAEEIKKVTLHTPVEDQYVLYRDPTGASEMEVGLDVDIHSMSQNYSDTYFPFGYYALEITFGDGNVLPFISHETSDWNELPNLVYPQGGEADVSVTPTILWQPNPAQVAYSMEIVSLDSLGSYEIRDISSASSSYVIPAGVLDGGTNYMLTMTSYGIMTRNSVRTTFKTAGSPSGNYVPFTFPGSEYSVSLSRVYNGYDSAPDEFETFIYDDFTGNSNLLMKTPNGPTFTLFSSPLPSNEFSLQHELALGYDPITLDGTTIEQLGQYTFELRDASNDLNVAYYATTPEKLPEFPFLLSPPSSAEVAPGQAIVWEPTSELFGTAVEFDFSGSITNHHELETCMSPNSGQWNLPNVVDFQDQVLDLGISAVAVNSGTNTFASLFSGVELSYFLSESPIAQKWEVERNDTLSAANEITAASPILGMIGNEKDLDWYTFSGTQGEDITIELFAMTRGSMADCRLEVWLDQSSTGPIEQSESRPAQSKNELPDRKVDVVFGKLEDSAQQLWKHFHIFARTDDPGLSFTVPETGDYYIKVAGKYANAEDGNLGPFYQIQLTRGAKSWQMPTASILKPGGARTDLELYDDGQYGELASEATFGDSFPPGYYSLDFGFPDGTTTEFRFSSVDTFPSIPIIKKPANDSDVTVPVQVEWDPVQEAEVVYLDIEEADGNFQMNASFPEDVTNTVLHGVPSNSSFFLGVSGETTIDTADPNDGRLLRQVMKQIQFSTLDSITPTPTPTPVSNLIVPSTDYPTIQSAIDAAQTGNTITVKPGTYFENINLKSKNIILTSQEPSDLKTVESTIIDGGRKDAVITMGGGEPPTCVIAGFTIQNGTATNGGGIAARLSRATIRDNRIVKNFSENGGGIRDSNGLIENNYIARNTAWYGGGLAWCIGTIRNNQIVDNEADYAGGIYTASGLISGNFIARNNAVNAGGAGSACNGNFYNNMIVNNSSDNSAGAFFLCAGSIVNNTFFGNTATRFGGALWSCNGTITNNIFWNNKADSGQAIQSSSTPNYCCIDEGSAGGVGNISKDPLFVNPNGNDFHLTEFSPCIDSATLDNAVTQDFDGDKRPIDGTSEPRVPYYKLDIGADEFDPGPERPSFTVQVLNPSVVVKEGERPVFNIDCQTRAGFNKKITFSIPNAPFNYVFNPNPFIPPGAVTLLLGKAGKTTVDVVQPFTIRAVSASGNIVRDVSASYTIIGSETTDPKLTFGAWPSRVRSGSIVVLRGRTIPSEASADIDIAISRIDPQGAQFDVPSIQTQADANGVFKVEYEPKEVGTYTFIASAWLNDVLAESEPVQVQVFSKTSRISLKVDPQNEIVAGSALPFSGRLSPMIEGESPKVDLNVWYNPTGTVTEPDETVQVDLVQGAYSETVTLSQSGIAVLQTRWSGSPPDVQGAESPRVVVPVSSAQNTSVAEEYVFNPGASILVAGATSSNLVQSVRDYLTNLGYYVLRQRRYNDLKLEYMNDKGQQDYDGDGNLDPVVDIVESSVSGLSSAFDVATAQAGASGPVSVFIVGEKGDGVTLKMGDGSTLKASDLDSLITTKCGSTRDVRVFVEASNCGDFCNSVAAPYRTVIGSASTETASYFSNGLLSFTQLYMTQVQAGWSIERSFEYSKDYLLAALGFFGAQTPVLISSDELDPELLYYGISSDATDMLPPQIESIFEPAILEGTDEVEIFALATDDTGISTVEALVRKPDGTTESILMQEELPGSRRYDTTLDRTVLDQLGTYTISIVAVDDYKNASEPATSQLSLITLTDLDGDSEVGPGDLCIIITEMQNPDSLYDIVIDGEMNSKDLMQFGQDWRE